MRQLKLVPTIESHYDERSRDRTDADPKQLDHERKQQFAYNLFMAVPSPTRTVETTLGVPNPLFGLNSNAIKEFKQAFSQDIQMLFNQLSASAFVNVRIVRMEGDYRLRAEIIEITIRADTQTRTPLYAVK